MAVPSVGHAEHHTAHKAGAHSTGICAWLCAAGESIESGSVTLNPITHLVERTVIVHIDPAFTLLSFHYLFRGPPSFLA